MRPRTEFKSHEVAAIRRAMHRAKNRSSFQRLQCLWLRAKEAWTTVRIAQVVGLSISHIRRIWSDYLRGGLKAGAGRPKGGRQHEHLSLQEERAFLAAFEKEARAGPCLTARAIKPAYEQQVGKAVPDSTVCRLLARHQWRRIQPRPKHPRRSLRAQTLFKKNASTAGPCRGGFLPPDAVTSDV
jgi:transposase